VSAKPEGIVKVIGAALYCVFMYRQLTTDEPVGVAYARAMRGTARVCQAVARRFGQWGLNAELEYRKALDVERMN
jgi:hypothetical protein